MICVCVVATSNFLFFCLLPLLLLKHLTVCFAFILFFFCWSVCLLAGWLVFLCLPFFILILFHLTECVVSRFLSLCSQLLNEKAKLIHSRRRRRMMIYGLGWSSSGPYMLLLLLLCLPPFLDDTFQILVIALCPQRERERERERSSFLPSPSSIRHSEFGGITLGM